MCYGYERPMPQFSRQEWFQIVKFGKCFQMISMCFRMFSPAHSPKVPQWFHSPPHMCTPAALTSRRLRFNLLLDSGMEASEPAWLGNPKTLENRWSMDKWLSFRIQLGHLISSNIPHYRIWIEPFGEDKGSQNFIVQFKSKVSGSPIVRHSQFENRCHPSKNCSTQNIKHHKIIKVMMLLIRWVFVLFHPAGHTSGIDF